MVEAYRRRPPYPEEAVEFLVELAGGEGNALLDVGAGRGDLTIPLAPHFARVDAVEPSPGMIREARRIAGDSLPHVRWVQAILEDAALAGPYALVTAGQSLHWTEWGVALPKLAGLLDPGGVLAIVSRRFSKPPWHEELAPLLASESTNREVLPYDLVEELSDRGLFRLLGRRDTPWRPLVQPVDAYVESLHSANGFSRDRMERGAAEAFDRRVRELVAHHAPDGKVRHRYGARIEFGRPLEGTDPG